MPNGVDVVGGLAVSIGVDARAVTCRSSVRRGALVSLVCLTRLGQISLRAIGSLAVEAARRLRDFGII
jgi:hypothetical protein